MLCACSKLIDPRAIKCLEKTWIYYPALHLRSWELQERKKPQHGFALHWRERKLLRLSDDCGLTLWPRCTTQCSACLHANQCTVQLYSNLCHLRRATKFDAKLLGLNRKLFVFMVAQDLFLPQQLNKHVISP